MPGLWFVFLFFCFAINCLFLFCVILYLRFIPKPHDRSVNQVLTLSDPEPLAAVPAALSRAPPLFSADLSFSGALSQEHLRMAAKEVNFLRPMQLFWGVSIALLPVWGPPFSRARGLPQSPGVADHHLDCHVPL